jgi:Holliday junction resolvase RusA-like endonuclease
MRVIFGIPGVPYGKARHRTTKMGIAYTPKETVQYENLVRTIFVQQHGDWEITLLPLRMVVTAIFPIPKSASKKMREAMIEGTVRPTKRPDWDNIGKIISDSLNEIAYKDDSQLVDVRVFKYYGEIPQVNVVMETNDRGVR